MVEERGQVINVSAEGAVVAVVQTSACQGCKARQGCGQAVLSEWGSTDRQDAKNHFFIDKTGIQPELALRPGDVVRLGIPEDALSRAAVWMYLWPLLPVFFVLWAGTQLSIPEPAQLLTALLAGAAAVVVTRWRFATPGQTGRPRILSIETPATAVFAREAG
ncbi:MAG: SoxR reducing system RseC family protein [Saccharospirillum sp.]|uniref:SoxR reducing system RseC family protein n=1 Tax=Saccharospirillum sp. TaxID=2033801 RepID=UPI0034A0284C